MVGLQQNCLANQKLKYISLSVSHVNSAKAIRSFFVVPYVDRDGVPMPKERPRQGPCYQTDGRPCHVVTHHWRSRLTGPKHRLLVMRCKVHGGFFTVYPAGFARYQRHPVAQTAYGNDDLRDAPVERPLESFECSQFQAALDASEGNAWLREWVAGLRQWWQTQRRQLARALILLGLDPGMEQERSLRIAQVLDLDHLSMVEQKRKMVVQPGYRCRGHGVVVMLRALVKRTCPVKRLLLAGHLAGLWGRPLWWDAEAGIVRKVPFRVAGAE